MPKRLKFQFKGIVQGVGFRPFIYRYAKELGLKGFVRNNTAGVDLEIEGDRVDDFLDIALKNIPPLAKIDEYFVTEIEFQKSTDFKIIASNKTNTVSMMMSPDIAICESCKKEFYDKNNRRYKYPFINCTDCGPRFSIIKELPYDRPKTTMQDFEMCEKCENEYKNPLDRRYHAQPVSCYDCGPRLTFDGIGNINQDEAFNHAIDKIKKGKVVAIKGLGGFHLSCLASSDMAVKSLRKKKMREKKPFAMMGTIDMVKDIVNVSEAEEKILTGITAPIVLLKRKQEIKYRISEYVAPEQILLGFMIPYTPLHMKIIDEIGEPLVMTSANISDEPIIYKDDNKELGKLSDNILSHDREINIFTDDSVMEVLEDKPYMIRRSRGYAPSPYILPIKSDKKILSLGAMLKTTFSMIKENKVYMSQYIGNTDSPVTLKAERKTIKHFQKLFYFEPELIIIDKHPDFQNRSIADEFENAEVVEIQHHKAHIGALLAEKGELGNIIGLSMDGTGYGDDGNIWGGEFFIGDYKHLERFAHLKYLNLPGGERAIEEPWRFALSILYEAFGDSDIVEKYSERYSEKGKFLLETLKKIDNPVLTSSCGRLFDAVANIIGLGNKNYYDGYLPIMLQNRASESERTIENYSYKIENENGLGIINFLPTIRDIIENQDSLNMKALKFHNTLSRAFADVCLEARNKHKINKVGLTGGVFQNTLLLKLTKKRLKEFGFEVLFHSLFAPNDSSISLGQGFLSINN